MNDFITNDRIDEQENAGLGFLDVGERLGWTDYPNAVMTSPVLSPASKQVYCQIRRYARMKYGAFPKIETLAKENGWKTRKPVYDALEPLIEIGLIIKKRRGAQKSNEYLLAPLTNELIRKLKPTILDESDVSKSEHHKSDVSKSEHHDVSKRKHQDPSDVSKRVHEQQRLKASNKEDSKQAGEPAGWQSHPKYQELEERYGEKVLQKAWDHYLQGVNEGKWEPKRLIPFFYHIVETDILPLVERELIPPGYNMPSLEDLKRQEQVEEEMEQERRRRQQQQQAREFDGLPKAIRRQMEMEARGDVYEPKEDPEMKAKIMEELNRMRRRFEEKQASGQ